MLVFGMWRNTWQMFWACFQFTLLKRNLTAITLTRRYRRKLWCYHVVLVAKGFLGTIATSSFLKVCAFRTEKTTWAPSYKSCQDYCFEHVCFQFRFPKWRVITRTRQCQLKFWRYQFVVLVAKGFLRMIATVSCLMVSAFGTEKPHGLQLYAKFPVSQISCHHYYCGACLLRSVICSTGCSEVINLACSETMRVNNSCQYIYEGGFDRFPATPLYGKATAMWGTWFCLELCITWTSGYRHERVLVVNVMRIFHTQVCQISLYLALFPWFPPPRFDVIQLCPSKVTSKLCPPPISLKLWSVACYLTVSHGLP